MNNIYLVGFMGTGKTLVGKELARQTRHKFLDIDEVIEEKEKRDIADIFAKDGEASFRKLEKEVLARLAQKENLVVSCGGGIVLDRDNIELMKNTGKMICLSASVEVILQRTRVFKNRPLLNVANPREKIEELLKARAPFYSQADIIIDTSSLSAKEVAAKILEAAL